MSTGIYQFKKRKGLFKKGHKYVGKPKGYKSPKGSLAKIGVRNPNFGKHWKFSDEIKQKIREAKIGDKNPNWKGGITPEITKARNSFKMQLWREAVFVCYNYTCQKCGQKGGKLCVHHIFNFSTYLDLRFAIDNGITFCQKCHRKFHYIYGRKNNTQEQLDEFLNN